MRRIQPGDHIILKHDPMYVRCGSELSDTHYLRYHIIRAGQKAESRYDIYEESDIAAMLLGKKIGDHVKINVDVLGISFDYEIVDINVDINQH